MFSSEQEIDSAFDDLLAGSGKFRPYSAYNSRHDCIEFVGRPDRFYAERVDDRLTVFISEDSGEVVGGLLKGIKALIERGGTILFKSDGRIRVAYLIVLAFADEKSKPSESSKSEAHKSFLQAVENAGVEADMELACV